MIKNKQIVLGMMIVIMISDLVTTLHLSTADDAQL